MSKQVVLESITDLSDDIVPVAFVFFYEDGRQAMLPFSSAWEAIATALERATLTMKAKAETETELRKHSH